LSIQTHFHQPAKVAILLATFNGERFLQEQLASIEAQEHNHWVLYASDDGSTDATLDILQNFQQRLGTSRVHIRQGPGQGLCANFLGLAADATIEADFFAFCDQDDVWLPTKLVSALQALLSLDDHNRPLLYGSRTSYVRDDLSVYGMSPAFNKKPSLLNALVQSLAGGNTMVFNRTTKQLLADCGVKQAVLHDWWLYILVTAAGGQVVFDQRSHILYRQHDASIIGAANTWSDRLARICMVLNGQFKTYTNHNLAALTQANHCLSPESIELLGRFVAARTENRVVERLRLLKRCGVHRQTTLGTYSLLLAGLLGKI
jgi:glycosyltransferase involved in cell wall biosynthesis